MSRTTLQDVARTAGVSLATVDRVLNRRPGVHVDTADRVQAAVDLLKYRPDRLAARLARGRDHRFRFVLPAGNNAFMQALEKEVLAAAERFADERVQIAITHVDVFDGDVLSEALEKMRGEVDGVAVVALDHPTVREAIDDLTNAGVTVVTLVSDVPRARRAHYVGIDNSAAGCPAAASKSRARRAPAKHPRSTVSGAPYGAMVIAPITESPPSPRNRSPSRSTSERA